MASGIDVASVYTAVEGPVRIVVRTEVDRVSRHYLES